MIPVATEQQNQLLEEAQRANQQISEAVNIMLAELQKPKSRRQKRRNVQTLVDHLTRIYQQLEQQRKSQEQIQQLIANQPCTASKLIFDQISHQPATSERHWRVSRDLPNIQLPPRLIGSN